MFAECPCAAVLILSVSLLSPATFSVCSSPSLSGEPSPYMDQARWPHLAQKHACFRSHKQWCKSRHILHQHIFIFYHDVCGGFMRVVLLKGYLLTYSSDQLWQLFENIWAVQKKISEVLTRRTIWFALCLLYGENAWYLRRSTVLLWNEEQQWWDVLNVFHKQPVKLTGNRRQFRDSNSFCNFC